MYLMGQMDLALAFALPFGIQVLVSINNFFKAVINKSKKPYNRFTDL